MTSSSTMRCIDVLHTQLVVEAQIAADHRGQARYVGTVA